MNARPVRKKMLMLGAVAVAFLGIGATAIGAQQVPPSGGPLAVGAAPVPAAGTVSVSGRGCAPRAGVGVSVAGQDAGATVADAKGGFARAVTIPAAAVGKVTVVATCAGPHGETHILTGAVVVTDSAAGSRPLPPLHRSTGGIPTSAVLAFFVACVVAALVVALIRLVRRRQPRRVPVPALEPRVPVVVPAPAPLPPAIDVPAVDVPAVQMPVQAPVPAVSNAELLELAAGVASALERVTTVSERVIAHVEYSRAQLQTALAAERADRRATLDALHELVRVIDNKVDQP